MAIAKPKVILRNYTSEMHERIKKAIPEYDYVPSIIAMNVIDRVEKEDPELLSGFLVEQAVRLVSEAIVEMSVNQRKRYRAAAARTEFSEAAARFEAGDETALSPFYAEFTVDVENTRRQAANMTGADHLFVATRYRKVERTSKMQAAFHEAVAQKVGDKQTKDVFTEEEYSRLYQSITGAD